MTSTKITILQHKTLPSNTIQMGLTRDIFFKIEPKSQISKPVPSILTKVLPTEASYQNEIFSSK